MNKIKEYDSQIEFVKNEDEFLNSSDNETALITLKQTEVCYGADDSCNVEYCKENNIPYIHQSKLQGGGCIVGVEGNIFIDVKRKLEDRCLSDKFSYVLADYFKEIGLSAVRTDNNDVLINDFKVASGCETTKNGWQYMGYQISINQDLELIRNVCNKEMVKIPKGLSEFGITTNDMVKFCKDYWSEH